MTAWRALALALATAVAACGGTITGQAPGASGDDSPSDPANPGSKPGMSGGGKSPGGGTDPGVVMPPPSSLPGSGGATTGSPGSGGSSGADVDAGASDGAPGAEVPEPPCQVIITPVAPPRLLNLVVGQTLRVHADVRGPQAPTTPAWHWDVMLADQTPVSTTPSGGDPSTVELVLATVGTYHIHATAASGCTAEAVASAVDASFHVSTLLLRAIPPPALHYPPQEGVVLVQAGRAPVGNVALMPGMGVTIDPQRPSGPQRPAGLTIPSYVRIWSPDSTVRFEGHTKLGPFMAPLPTTRNYQVLIIPDDPLAPEQPIAPALVGPLPPQQLAAQRYMFDDGTLVAGQVLVGAGASTEMPVAGARVLLRAGPLPSTLGRTAADGSFELRARGPARFSAVVVPPPDSGLPQAELAAGAFLDVGQAPVDLTFRYQAPTTKRLDLLLTSAEGAAPAAPVRVRLESAPGALPVAGTFEMNGGKPLAASGSLRLEGTTNAGGFVSFSRVPPVLYRLVALPATDADDVAITEAMVDASIAGTHKLALERPVRLNGRLQPLPRSAGLTVVAVDTDASAPGDPLTAVVDAEGKFSFKVAPKRNYRLYTEPNGAKKLPRLLLGLGWAGSADLTPTLPATLPLGGVITSEGQPVPGTLIQIFCTGPTPDCVGAPGALDADSVRPVAEAVTGDDGRYQVDVPDPAQWNL